MTGDKRGRWRGSGSRYGPYFIIYVIISNIKKNILKDVGKVCLRKQQRNRLNRCLEQVRNKLKSYARASVSLSD